MTLSDASRKAMFVKMKKLENFLEHARTQEVPISKKEDQLLRLKAKLGLTDKLDRSELHRLEFLQGKREIA